MRGTHVRTVGSGKQHGQTVGHHDRAGYITIGSSAGVGLSAVNTGAVQCLHLEFMNLLQEHRSHTDGSVETPPIDCDS